MARKKKKSGGGGEGVPEWMITFSDMMTLMLTFFVLLVSMATMDARRRLITLGSLIGTFGIGDAGYDMRSTEDKRTTVEPGPIEDVKDLEPLKEMLWDKLQDDVDFQFNKFVQILSIADEVLYKPGQTQLSTEGKKLVDHMLPLLLEIESPLLLAGHASSSWGEQQGRSGPPDAKEMDASWKLSLYRTISLYRYLLERGMDPDLLRMEAFGRFSPRHGRVGFADKRQRRVDFVLDKRNVAYAQKLEAIGRPRKQDHTFFNFKDFSFDIQSPGEDYAQPPAEKGE